MTILSRDEIISLFKSSKLKIDTPNNSHQTAATLPYSKDNPFQQCSLDLHVGEIFIPETQDEELGGMFHPKTDGYVLGTGETLLIRTREKITLPNNVGAICFSPSRLALKGVLITNMGHVDPGYSGYLHFTAINMGKEKYDLRADADIICTMLLFQLTQDTPAYGNEYVKKLNIAGRQAEVSGSVYYSLPRLAGDFVNVKKRARDAAKEEIDATKLWQVRIPLGAAAIVGIFSLLQAYVVKPWDSETQKLNSKIEVLEKRVDYEKRLNSIEKSINEMAINKKNSRQ